jgi:hypothetical protein
METTSYNQGHQGPRYRGLAILETEVSIMTTALKRSNVWSRSDAVSAHPTLLKPFIGLRSELNGDSEQLDDLDPNVFLAPFLDVIRSDVVTGKSFSEALIFTSTNPQYDKRLFIELQVQYMKIPSSEHGENML